MKKLLFAAINMNIGGVEKSLISLLRSLSPEEYEVDLLLFEKSGGFLADIPNWVNIIVLKEYPSIKADLNQPPLQRIKAHLKNRNIFYASRLILAYSITKITSNYLWYYKEVFRNIPALSKEYDIAVSYSSIINYLSFYVMSRVFSTEKIGWIHFDVSKLGGPDKALFKMHSQMDKIYVVSQDSLSSFNKLYPALKNKSYLRYNVIDPMYIQKQSEKEVPSIKDPGTYTIITLGRLSEEKGQDIIPEVASILKANGIPFKWFLIGDGNLRSTIQSKIVEHDVKNQIVFLGTQSNPYPYLKQGDIYVQTSLHEGYCITLAEAKVFDLPIISVDFSGAREQLAGRSNCTVVSRNAQDISSAILATIKK